MKHRIAGLLVAGLVGLLLMWPMPGWSAPSTILLDFEDDQLPDVHGWQRIVNDQGVNTIVPGVVPGGTGSKVLEISGEDRFGWWMDLEGMVSLGADWTFSVDLRCVSASVSQHDTVVARVGRGNGGHVLSTPSTDDGYWHNLRLEMNQATHTVSSFLDGVLVGTDPPYDDGPYSPYFTSSNAIGFLYANQTQSKTIQFDNVYFEWEIYTTYLPAVLRHSPFPRRR